MLQLNKELLQSGELHQTYQKRLGEVMRSHQAQAQTALLADALNAELVGTLVLLINAFVLQGTLWSLCPPCICNKSEVIFLSQLSPLYIYIWPRHSVEPRALCNHASCFCLPSVYCFFLFVFEKQGYMNDLLCFSTNFKGRLAKAMPR